ncbi:MAG: mechanosensitive ion channel family protein [Bacteroidetes bacterium]|nr:mechanosensitive ion channel family protein [Bacteroidota bacterium]
MKKPEPAVVAPYGDSLFTIYEKIGAYVPTVRARAITERLEAISEKSIFSLDSFRIENSDFTTDIMYGDLPLMSVSDADAKHEGASREELAKLRVLQIQASISTYKEEFSWRIIVKKTLLLLLLLIILSLIILGINKIFRWLYQLIRNTISPRLKGFRIGKAQFTNADKISILLIRIAQWIKVIVIIVVIYVSLPLIIYLIPSSRSFTDKLLEYTLTPLTHFIQSFINYIPNLFTIAVIVLLFTLFIGLFRFLAEEIGRGSIIISGFYRDWAVPTFNIIRFVLYAFMFIVIFPYLPGSSSPIFQGVSVFLGLLVSLGSAGSISNIIAGIVITYMRSFDLGDRIRIGDVEGDVVEKSMLVTRIRTIKNEEISVPNNTLMNGNVINFSKMARENKLIIYTSVTIGYDAPWRDVHLALINAASKTERILKDPKPFVLQRALNDFYVEYQINAYIHDAQAMADIYSDLHQSIQDSFNEAGIEIMSSHYMNLRDGNKTTIPENYLPKDYERPGFKIEEDS